MSQATERVTAEDAPPSRRLTQRVEEILARGALAALPTETVYGIAARVDRPEGWERLRAAKGLPAGRAATWHVAGDEALERYPSVSPMVRRLVRRYWPGPLTLVLPGVPAGLERVARDGWTGVRRPAHGLTAGLLAALDFPVVLSSANPHGAEPLRSAADVARAFAGQVELVVDAGPARLGEASAVLQIGPGRFELLRPGLFRPEELRAAAGLRIAFVCTGNTCRSPMAEGLARAALAERLGVGAARLADFGFELVSLGVHAAYGEPASEHAVAVLAERGVDLSGHRSRAAAAERVEAFQRVYAMTAGHLEALRLSLPPTKAAGLALLDPDGRDIPDPIGGTREDYALCAERIADCIARRLDEWA